MQKRREKPLQEEPPKGLEQPKETGDKLFNALLSTIRQTGNLDLEILREMEESYGRLSDARERYRCLVKGYRTLRLALVESGNSVEAQLVKGKESNAKTGYY
jgi:hypothetical protein